MRKIYNSLLNRNSFLSVLFFVSFFSANAQTPTYFKGVGTGSNTIPMNTAGSHTQQIYQPGDFNSLPISGLITKIYFRNAAAGASGTYTNFSVAFLQNSMAAFPNNTFLTGFTTALSTASITINGNATAGGWYEIPLTTPFAYDNSQTLIVEIKYTARTGGMSTPTSTATGNKRLSIITAPGPATGNLSTIWGDYGMDVIPSGPCTNPPVPGTVSSSANPVCLGVPFTLTMTGGTNGSGQVYQWQSSPDGTTWTDITGATNTSYTTSQSASTYYRINVTCGVTVSSNAVQILTPAGVSGTFTINNLQPTGGTNFQSFNAAYDYIKCGITGPVTFNVDPLSGPYDEQLVMIPVPGASATNTVTFNGNGRTLSFNSTTSAERGVIKLNGADHIRFNNLVITAPGTLTSEYGFGVQLLNDADSNIISNCTINLNTISTSTNYAGIVISASATSATTTGSALCDANIFTGNTINGGYYGITIVGSTSAANQNNVISNNKILDFYQYGVYLLGNFNTLVDSNVISRPTRTATAITTFYGVYVTSLNVSVNITRNTITDPFGGAPTSTSAFNGIYFTGVDALAGVENKVINNLIYNMSGSGDAYGLYNTSSDNVWYIHNTVSVDGAGGTGISRGFYQTTSAAGIRFVNNIVSVTRAGTGAKYAIYYNTIASDIISDRNDFYIASPTGNDFTGFYTTARATLLDWQTASGDDANSVATNPMFQDAATGNYRPTNASIDNLGAPEGVTVDITNITRSATTPDIGAYEFTPGNCTVPPTAGTATISNTPVCVNVSVGLSLTGNSIGAGQTYQWQSGAAAAGPFTTIGNVLTNPDTTIISSTTLYYRVAVTCSGNTTFSVPVLLTVNPALPAGNYTINALALPSATNFTSFNAAKAAMACGIAGSVVFDVAPGSGPYNEQLILDSIPGTSALSTITFNGNGNTIAFSSNATDERAVIKFRGVDFVTFDSLTIDATGTGTYGFGVQMLNNADTNKINNCIILANTTSTSTNYAGIAVSASATSATTTGNTFCDGNVFSNNTITGGYYSITLVGSTTAAVRDNFITNNNVRDFYLYGIYLSGNYNTLVEANNISRPARTAVSTFYGVYMTSLNVSLDISKNRIHNGFDGDPTSTSAFYGIYATGVDALAGFENIVSNNIVYNVNGQGTEYGIYNTSSNNIVYYHNTISLDNESNISTNATYGFYQTTLSTGIDLRNNIFTITRGGGGNRFGINLVTTTSEVTSNFNDIYVPGSNGFTGHDGSDYVTLAQWQAATNRDLNSISTNPFYSSVATGNLKPQSPVLDNKGTPIASVTTDIENTVRNPATPDVGAYEFSVPPCLVPPTAGGAAAFPISGICLGDEISLSLSGFTLGAAQTYQWQTSATAGGPYTNLGGVMQFPDTTVFATVTLYYRVAVTCSGNTSFSAPVLVTINPAFIGGFYTINPANPPFYPAPGSTNFQSFSTAVAALDCGITDAVTFDVAAGTYTEQIRIHEIAGTSPTKRITFRSATGTPSSVTLTFDATSTAANFVLKLDSASYITFKNMTITASNTTNGRAIELANTASYDSIVNCILVAPTSTSTANTSAGIFADLLRGSHNVIKGNMISNGSSGIYLEGTAAANLTYDNVIDSNIINNSYYYGIYVGYNGRANVSHNAVNLTSPRNTTNYGIYSTSSDSAFRYVSNNVNITGLTSTTTYGMYFTGCNATDANRARIANNMITGLTGNTGTLYGMYQTGSTFNNTVNNVISINTSGATSYGSYSTGSGGVNFLNNSILNTSASTTVNNIAAYFSQTSAANGAINVQNNIFSHQGGGRAMFMANLGNVYSNYNTFYTTGTVLIAGPATTNTYATLPQWMNVSFWDLNSIAIAPAFANNTTLQPDLTNPDVWAIHGRGIQLPGNDYDFNNSPRPTTVTTGVPDMGAYEFLPTALPTLLIPTPATPAAGITQTFMYGTDTVAKITYDAAAPVPASINLRRYSGVLPTGLSAGQQSMYFYTDIDVPAQGAYKYKMQQFYIDPWIGFIPSEPYIKMGRTNSAGTWLVSAASTADNSANIIKDTALVHMDKYTGLAGDPSITPNIYTTVIDTSNRGTRFWVPYGNHYDMNSGNGQDMWLYLSAQDSANVTVRVNGTSYSRSYAIPANTVRVSDIMPKSGLIDARILDEGLYDHGISITSDVPIVAYAHIYAGSTSGATMLLPVGVYGYEYQSLNAVQYYSADSYSWMNVISDRDSTLVEITPSVLSKGGHPAGVPFTVLLMRGQVYSLMGTTNGAAGTELTGTRVKSIANASGNCYPMAVFSGSTRTAICQPQVNGDNIIQQVFPSQAWGKRYLTFATANSLSNTNYNSNVFRVMVKDPTTVVTKNGVVLPQATLVIPGNYYEFSTTQGTGANGAIYVEADKPVMVAQYMVSTGATGCPGVTTSGVGDPEMIYISPIEQGIKKVAFYNTNESAITANYVNVVIPTAGLASLRIDGNAVFTDVFAHPFLPGYTGVRHNLGAASGQHIMTSDSAFTAITYGLGSVESYGYNAGTLVKNLNALPNIVNTFGNGAVAEYTCANTPFNFNILITSKPQQLLWKLNTISTLSPNANITQVNPAPLDSTLIGGRWFYRYSLPTGYMFSTPGTYSVPILITDSTTIEGCDHTQEITLTVNVKAGIIADFATAFTGCLGAPVQFTGIDSTADGVDIMTWNWAFGDAVTGTGHNISHTYTAAGTYNVSLNIIAQDGCIGDTIKQVIVSAVPAVAVVSDSLTICGTDPAVFQVQNPDPASTYDWFTTLTGGAPIFTGPSYTAPPFTGIAVYFVQATNASGCISERRRVTARLVQGLAVPVVTADSIGADRIVFRWSAVPNAVSYEVSTDNGINWIIPSSGPTGLTHTVSGLQPLQTVSLKVRARGAISCQESISLAVSATTLLDQIYIPNAFSPNGDNQNDIFKVYGYIIKSVRLIIFNQWGQKIFEANDQATGWNGTHKGKPQPSGVYMYVCEMILNDGTKLLKKGSINLVR